MLQEEINRLIDRYLDESIQPGEQQRLQQLLQEPALFRLFQDRMDAELLAGDYIMEPGEPTKAAITTFFDKELQPVPRVTPLRRWGWVAAAAMVLLVAGLGWLQYRHVRQASPTETAKARDVAPGKEGAILILADGRQVVLDSIGSGIVANEHGTEVLVQNGSLVYRSGTDQQAPLSYNTMATPRGRQFHMVLPDGTRVWLNAASRLRYPVLFEGTERRVELTGEAYFEVAKNELLPFKVVVNGNDIQVLGTSFNINAYDNEQTIQASLVEGAIKVAPALPVSPVILKPGQQARLTLPEQGRAAAMKVVNADMEQVLAWKNNLFNFEKASVAEVMRQLERWYDIEVVYENGVPDLHFLGAIGKDLTLAEALAMLKGASVHFRIEEGRKLVVLP